MTLRPPACPLAARLDDRAPADVREHTHDAMDPAPARNSTSRSSRPRARSRPLHQRARARVIASLGRERVGSYARDVLARVAVPLLLLSLLAGACRDDVDLGDDAGTSDGDEVCGGVAYTRTDLPGTALCLDGTDSFQCTWVGNNAAIKGHFVEGNHDAANGLLTLAIPDDVARTSFTTYEFAAKLGQDGVDLVLELMGVRAGEYGEVAGWAAAVDGDGGLCGGRGGACDGPCSSDADCGSGRACIGTTEGDKCLPAACDTCFDADQLCNYYSDNCEFESCSDA